MKKFAIAAITVAASATVAVASSLSIPWFVDNSAPGNGTIGNASGTMGVVTLKSNVAQELTLTIEYFSQDGVALGPQAPFNTFNIAPKSALAFRPTEIDPAPDAVGLQVRDAVTGQFVTTTAVGDGQEGAQGVQVPDRPRSADASTPIVGHPTGAIDTRKNGSITISWQGGDKDVQGQVVYFRTVVNGNGSRDTISYGHLLPPGF